MARRAATGKAGAEDRLRLDRWLWHVRAFRTRPLAASRISAGGVRVNGQPCRKPGRAVGPGDIVTFSVGSGTSSPARIFTYEVLSPGERRGPASEAATLYRDLSTMPESPSGQDEIE